jgi:hypothetical protein
MLSLGSKVGFFELYRGPGQRYEIFELDMDFGSGTLGFVGDAQEDHNGDGEGWEGKDPGCPRAGRPNQAGGRNIRAIEIYQDL